MPLIGRQPIHPVLLEQAVNRGTRHADLMKALQIVGDLGGAEVLTQVEDLADHGRRGRPR